VTNGLLQLQASTDVSPQAVTLYAHYVPRSVRQLLIHYRANWPCVPTLQDTNVGGMLYNWTLTQTNDAKGDSWLLASSLFPQSLSNSIPFADFGDLIKFSLRDMVFATNAFSVFTNDNSLYKFTGGQTFTLSNISSFITFYTNTIVPPHGTPIPWLIANGFTNNFATAELGDPDHDGIPTWQEYQAGTDPRSSNSMFTVLPLTQALDGRVQITFSTVSNRTYQLDTSTNLIDWQILVDGISGSSNPAIIPDTRFLPNTPTVFYRVLAY